MTDKISPKPTTIKDALKDFPDLWDFFKVIGDDGDIFTTDNDDNQIWFTSDSFPDHHFTVERDGESVKITKTKLDSYL